MSTKDKRIPVVVTTDSSKRGVFFAYIKEEDAQKDPLPAEEIQMVLYWSEDMRGVLGLAALGPSATCRVSPVVPKALIKGVTLVMECSVKAVKNWKAQPWGK